MAKICIRYVVPAKAAQNRYSHSNIETPEVWTVDGCKLCITCPAKAEISASAKQMNLWPLLRVKPVHCGKFIGVLRDPQIFTALVGPQAGHTGK